MTNATNPAIERLRSGLANSSASISVGDITVKGNVGGSIVVGNNNYVVHNYYGAVVDPQATPPTVKPHDMKQQPPRPPREFVGRGGELKRLISYINGNEAALVYGHDGIGKTTLIKQTANSDPAKAMPDGVVFLEGVEETGRILGLQDITQLLFDALFESNPPLKVTSSNARTYLSNTRPLVILDRFELPITALSNLPDLFPRGALVAAQREAPTGDGFQPVQLSPLGREESIQLLALKSGMAADTSTRGVVEQICELLGDIPLAIVMIANVIRNKGIALEAAVDRLKAIRPPSQDTIQAAIERGFGVAYSLLNETERKMLAMVAAAPGISVDRSWLENMAGGEKTSNVLESLELLQANSPRLRLPEAPRQVIQSGRKDILVLRELLLNHLLGELKTRALDFEFVADELGNILGLIQWTANEKRWSEVISLGKAVDPYLTLHGLWDAWAVILNLVLLAGQALKDQAVQAWALHQLGSREIGVGSQNQAIDYLVRALRIREALRDKVGAAYTRHNLNVILPPTPPRHSKRKSTILDPRYRGWILSLLLGIAAIIILFLTILTPRNPCPMPDGWQVYIVQKDDTLDSITQRIVSVMNKDLKEKGFPVVKLAIQNANSNCIDTRASPETTPTLMPEVEKRQRLYVPVAPATPIVTPPETGPAPKTYTSTEITLGLSRKPDAVVLNKVGQVINYVYDIANSGSGPLPGPLTIKDNKTTARTCPELNTVGNLNGNLDPNEIITCTATYSITQADLDNGSVTNVATANTGGIDSNQATLTVEVAQNPALKISKDANPTVYHQVGQAITYTYTILNSGNVTLSPVQFQVSDDHIGEGMPFNCGPEAAELAPDATVTCTATYVISPADMEARTVTNSAKASIYVLRRTLITTVPETTTIHYVPPPTLTKTANPTVYEKVGQTIMYTYIIKNIGNVPLPGPVTVDDVNKDIKTSVPCPDIRSIAPDETITCTANYTIAQDDLDRGSVTNVAVARVGDIDSNQATVTIEGKQIPELKLTKTADPVTYDHVGQTITYTYVILNSGNITFRGQFTVRDDRINGATPFNCGPDTTILVPETTITCTAVYNISPTDIDARSVTNNATASWEHIISPPATAVITCPPAPAGWVVYIIQRGDTLSLISSWYRGMTVERLMQANCLSSTTIYPGQELYVPSPPPPAAITGIVFADPNHNNQQDQGEEGLPNIAVTLMDLDTKAIVATTVTKTGGKYTFSGLKPGNYQVFQVPIRELRTGETRGNVNFGISPSK